MQKLSLATLSTLAFTLASTNVFAVDGTITVNGVVTDQTCTLQASGNGSEYATGLKDITVDMGAWPKSWFTPTNQSSWWFIINLYIKNADGTANCDAATIGALKGIHLSAISPDHLDTADKTLLVNQASGASSTNPIFIRFRTMAYEHVDFSEPWGRQAKSGRVFMVGTDAMYLEYYVAFVSKTGVVDAQNVNAKINYTIHYN
ncbi:type 1 fimbrial protein [Acinetobacter sp. NyZ410]|uniref:fimbrial protein n=1 Tax=Acinetobacter sp. NyZ410 TaxID=2929509 RepID=UPI001FBAB8A5|nr:type 1 fimbrial protein [Acinetobacter sp. NyZ410]UOH17290.1 type 1 fimbrial protein [Acinetobacter sp. NyZ410]